MSVAVLNGPTVKEFVEDQDAFNRCIDELFAGLDSNGDGVLSRSELMKGLDGLLMAPPSSAAAAEPESPLSSTMGKEDLEAVFDKFDGDRSGTVDKEEFKVEMREIMLAVARGIGDSPVQVALDSHGFLMRAVEHEQSASEAHKK